LAEVLPSNALTNKKSHHLKNMQQFYAFKKTHHTTRSSPSAVEKKQQKWHISHLQSTNPS